MALFTYTRFTPFTVKPALTSPCHERREATYTSWCNTRTTMIQAFLSNQGRSTSWSGHREPMTSPEGTSISKG